MVKKSRDSSALLKSFRDARSDWVLLSDFVTLDFGLLDFGFAAGVEDAGAPIAGKAWSSFFAGIGWWSSGRDQLEGSPLQVWVEPAFSAENPSFVSRHTIWPHGSLERGIPQSYQNLTPLPRGYEFSFPVLYEGEAFSQEHEEVRPVRIYRDWVKAPDSGMLLQIVIVDGS